MEKWIKRIRRASNTNMNNDRTRKTLRLFLAKLKFSDKCWEWSAQIDNKGYGKFNSTPLKEQRAHRASYKLFNGDVDDGKVIRHRCDNRSCVNPFHLEIGTHVDNVSDREKRKRTAYGFKIPRTKLSIKEVDALINSCKRGEMNQSEAAIKYNVSASYVSNLMTNKRIRRRNDSSTTG